jgi:LysR family hydrogen peroxide-inducible transcriptional activator
MRLDPHPVTLRQLQYAAAVAECLSFRVAAERCHVSQPSLSAQLAQLEDALGVQLFERDKRRVLVTSAGRAILERIADILRGADDLVDQARRASDPLSGSLRLGVIPTISPYLLPKLTTAVRVAHPRLTALWVEEKTSAVVHMVESGELDAALVAQEADLAELEREAVGSDVFVLATPKGHPLGKKGPPAKLSDLRDADVLLLDDGHCLRDQALSYCSRARANELDFRATSLPTLVQVVAGGAGVTLLPALAIPTEAKRANISLRPFAAPAPKRTIALVWRKRSPLGPALKLLAATVRETLAGMSTGG